MKKDQNLKHILLAVAMALPSASCNSQDANNKIEPPQTEASVQPSFSQSADNEPRKIIVSGNGSVVISGSSVGDVTVGGDNKGDDTATVTCQNESMAISGNNVVIVNGQIRQSDGSFKNLPPTCEQP